MNKKKKKTLNFSFKLLWRKQPPSRERGISGSWTRTDGCFVAEVMLRVTCVAVETANRSTECVPEAAAAAVWLYAATDLTTDRQTDRVDSKQTNKEKTTKKKTTTNKNNAECQSWDLLHSHYTFEKKKRVLLLLLVVNRIYMFVFVFFVFFLYCYGFVKKKILRKKFCYIL